MTKRILMLSALITALLVGSYQLNADTGRGALFGGLTGAAFGGALGGGRGAAIGGIAGLGLGAMIGSGSNRRGSDPYRQLTKEQRKLDSLQRKFDRAKSERRRQRIQGDIDRQLAKIRSLEDRLGIHARTGAPQYQPQRYQPQSGPKRF